MIFTIAFIAVFFYSLIIYWSLRSPGRHTFMRFAFCIVLGLLSAGISLALEYAWNYYLADFINSHKSFVFLESFIGVAVIEEGTKWLWFVMVISRWKSFDRYTEGILYACGIAAGFSLVENFLYAMVETSLGDMIVRSFTAIPIHFLFAIVMGFLFARYRFEGKPFLWFSFLVPVLLHGLYDFFILQPYAELLMGVALLVLGGCLALSIWICNVAVRADKIRVLDSTA